MAVPHHPSLYVYAEGGPDSMMKTYKYNGMDLECNKFVFEHSFNWGLQKISASRFVSVENVGVFSIANEGENPSDSMLVQFGSANIYGFQYGLRLARPPIQLAEYFDLRNLSKRGLYLLRERAYIPPRLNPGYDASKQEFSNDEIHREMYFYNMELDRWFPVPAMISQPLESCMTVLDDKEVYVIAGHGNSKMVQAYDHRERQWHSKPNVLHEHVAPQSCVLNGSIYVSSREFCERYDPVAARWEDVRFQENHSEVRRLISYSNQLWQFKTLGLDHFIEVYDPPTATWSTIPRSDHFWKQDQLLDAVVW